MDGRELLLDRAATASKQQIADELGISRTAVSLILNGKYDGKPDKVYRRALEIYGKHECPFLAERITRLECDRHSGREMPEGRAGVRHWRACKSCKQNRTGKDDEDL